MRPHSIPRLRVLLCCAGFAALAAAGAGRAQERPGAPEPGVQRPSLAVIPLRVHSAKPIGYLGDSLANLIRQRLSESGGLRVLDAAESGAGGDPGEPPPVGDGALRRLAESLSVDYVVSGSVTELAGRYSLDVRVTPASLHLRGHTRVLTADRDDALLGLVDELASRILEQVRGAEPALLAALEVVGAPGLEAELTGRLRSAVGSAYDEATVEQDRATLSADPRLSGVEVSTESGPGGVALRFQVIPAEPAPAPPQATPGTGDPVAEVRIVGNRRIEADAIRIRMGTRAGEPLRASQVAADVRAIHGLGFFRNVTVLAEQGPDGPVVIFQVEENPVVREIAISGNDSIDGERIQDILTLTTGSSLDYPLLFENRQRIEALYRAEGYYLAEVSSEVDPLSEASVAVNFDVVEGEKQKLREIGFSGNAFFTDGELTEGFQTRRWRFWSLATSWFDRSGTYSEPLFMQDLRGVEKRYTDAGFVQVQVGEPKVTASEDGLRVVVPITEGRRFRVGELDVAGDPTVDIEALRGQLALSDDEFFNRSHLTEDVDRIEEHYTDRGFYLADVTPVTQLSEETDRIDVTFQVRKGSLYFVRQIDISGNTTTVDPVIRREIPIVEGELYSRRATLLSKARVEGLGFFEEVDFRPEPTDEPDQLDLRVAVVERPTGSFSFGAGFSSQDAFVVTGSLSQSNLFGRGYGANISVDAGSRTQRFFVSLQDPSFLGSDFAVGAQVFRTNLRFEDFEQEQLGASLALGHAISPDARTRGSLRYQFAQRKVNDDSQFQAAAVILRDVIVDNWGSSGVELAVTSDTRNDRFAPNSGYSVGASLEAVGLGFDSQFLRAEAGGAWFLGAPSWLFSGSTFVVSSRLGYALPLNSIADWSLPRPASGVNLNDPEGNARGLEQIDDGQKLPLSERYFLGGLGTFQLRGFKARSVGPRRPILRQSSLANVFVPLGRRVTGGFTLDGDNNVVSADVTGTFCDSNGDGIEDNGCNDIGDRKKEDFEDLDATDVIGGNKFMTSSFEYRFPISETVGLQGVAFFDVGNAFAEGETLFRIDEWRYGTGVGVQWFSPFGPLAVVLGFPLNPTEIEDSPVFEFSVGGVGF